MKRENMTKAEIFLMVAVLIAVLIGSYATLKHKGDNAKVCVWAGCPIYGEGYQWEEFWLDWRCDTELKRWSGIILEKVIKGGDGLTYEQWDAERRAWIVDMLRRKAEVGAWWVKKDQ